MKPSTIVVLGVLAVGGVLVYRRFAGGVGAAPIKQSPTMPTDDKSPIDQLAGLATSGASIVNAGKDILAGLFGSSTKQSPTQPSSEPSPLDRLKKIAG